MTINHSPDAVLAEALAEQRRTELENAARAVIGDREYFNSRELERLTGTPSSTWRYWASGLMVTEMQRGTQLHSRISRVVAVNQMKKVNAVLGFTRLDEFDRVNDVAHRLVKLTRNGKPTWMPATEDRGEGIFLQLNVSQVEAWESAIRETALWAAHRDAHRRNFQRRFSERPSKSTPTAACPRRGIGCCTRCRTC